MTPENDHEVLIRLEGKVDTIIDKLREIPELDKRVRCLEWDNSSNKTDVSTIKGDISSLEKKSDSWSIINSIGVFVAGLFGIWNK